MTYYSEGDPYKSKICEHCGECASIYTGVTIKRVGTIYYFYHSHPCWGERNGSN